MQFSTNKAKATAIIVTILMVTSIALSAMPAQAQTTYTNQYFNQGSIPLPAGVTPNLTLDTVAHLSVSPNPVGLGQPFIVNIWLQPPIHNSRKWSNFAVTITKPDGTKDTLTMDSYLADGTAWFENVADQVGNWTIKFDFPGGYFPAGNYTRTRLGYADAVTNIRESVYYRPSSDGPYTITVQQDFVMSWPESPLPVDYWVRPVSAYHREWWPILGDFPWTGVGGGTLWDSLYPETNIYASNYRFVPYVQGPNSAHVLWKRWSEPGGIIGGNLGPISFWPAGGFTRANEVPQLIFAGRVYQGGFNKVIDGVPRSDVWQCYDLRTGEVIWEQYGVSQVPTNIVYTERDEEATPGEEARKSGLSVDLLYVGGGRYIKYNPWTGAVNVNQSIAPLTTGTLYADPYLLTVQDRGSSAGANRYRLINWTVGRHPDTGVTSLQIMNNISWPLSSIGNVRDYQATIALFYTGITPESTQVTTNYYLTAVSLATGQVLWNKTADVGYGMFSGSTAIADHGKFAARFNDGHWHCWDLNSGAKLWKNEVTTWPWSTFGCYSVESAYGLLYSAQYDGIVAYDWDTGKVAWHFEPKTDYAFETPYKGDYPFFAQSWLADGKYYTFANEHSISQPLYRGLRSYCVNATTGEEIWGLQNFGQPLAIADGYLISAGMYDGYHYIIGKGKSATTVSAPRTAITQGQSVVLTGTVLDMSPGQPGTPCVSKESMAGWMEYIHLQHPIPANVTGVPVSLDAFDPNGNYIHIGDTTSDMTGTFGFVWTPDVSGKYAVTATFMGDDSYGSSFAGTYVGVVNAPEQPPAPEPQQTTDNTPIFYGIAAAAVAIIMAIAILGILILRKR